MGAFDEYKNKIWKYRFAGELFIPVIAGGTPTDPKVAEAWIKTKMGIDSEQQIQEMVAKTMVERGVTADVAAEEVNMNRHLNGFKRTEDGELFYEGRCLKACIKEAVSVAADVGNIKPRGFGNNSRKGVLSFVAEHVFVPETRLLLGVKEPTRVLQKFVHTFRGSGIQYEEIVENATVSFTVETDHDFTDEEWAAIWLTAEKQGLGASRSQGFGVFEVTKWERRKK